MKTMYWNIPTKDHTFHFRAESKGLHLDEQRIEPPLRLVGRTWTPVDFQLPIDDVACWCRYSVEKKHIEIYVDGVLLPDVDNTPNKVRNPRWESIFFRASATVLFLMLLRWMIGIVSSMM